MTRAKADLVTGAVLIALGLATVEESWRMPTYTDQDANIWTAPGIVPGLLGVGLVLAAAILLLRSLAALRTEGPPPPVPEQMQGAWARVATVTVLCIAYAGGLVGRVPFWLATFLFIFATICTFELWPPEARKGWPRIAIVAALIAGVASGAISYIFSELFFVRLP